ncbi:DUF424 family protein [Candidatus Bathyarchaeota archaeon]|nr:DUF424 family protein [Candidatus Bathyarchaeota archaeon]
MSALEKVYVKVYMKDRQKLVAVCDSDLIGKTFREGKLKLEVTSKFYGGELVTASEALKQLLDADMGNLVGRNAVKMAVDSKLVDPDAIIYIAGIPHVQLLKL